MSRPSLLIGAALLLSAAVPARAQTPFEVQVLAELNAARRDPAGYVEQLRRYRGYYHANIVAAPGARVRYLTQEGAAPVDEAIGFLQHQGEHGELTPAGTLESAAADHCAEQAADGAVGHLGPDGSTPSDRVARRGGGIYVAEVIAYGADSAADVIRQLIIDDGVPDRGHRALLFADKLRFAGVSCGPHPEYRAMCVIDLARTDDGRSIYLPPLRRGTGAVQLASLR